ncbi:hypothetical protein [Pseudomonas fragi]|jgi:hypothetical protein|uniref:hypothetical protein n=1 Tax=Pseudomonas fragi TaxID=296 RepID=UPI0015960D8B|nr:hypothetical protein [Pseudomonas fragi]
MSSAGTGLGGRGGDWLVLAVLTGVFGVILFEEWWGQRKRAKAKAREQGEDFQ